MGQFRDRVKDFVNLQIWGFGCNFRSWTREWTMIRVERIYGSRETRRTTRGFRPTTTARAAGEYSSIQIPGTDPYASIRFHTLPHYSQYGNVTSLLRHSFGIVHERQRCESSLFTQSHHRCCPSLVMPRGRRSGGVACIPGLSGANTIIHILM